MKWIDHINILLGRGLPLPFCNRPAFAAGFFIRRIRKNVTFGGKIRYTGREEGCPTDRELISQLYERYSRRICLYLYSLCHDRALAEDLTQECFLKAILSLPDRREDLRAWLFTVARHLLMDQFRGRRDTLPLEGEILPAPEGDGPLAVYLRRERDRRLLELMTELEPRRREVLSLQYFSGLSQEEIASLLGLSHENVRVISLRARRELKQKLEEAGYDIS